MSSRNFWNLTCGARECDFSFGRGLLIPHTFYKIIEYRIENGRWRVARVLEEPRLKEIMMNS